jgi:hypothetical protein
MLKVYLTAQQVSDFYNGIKVKATSRPDPYGAKFELNVDLDKLDHIAIVEEEVDTSKIWIKKAYFIR